MKSGKYEQYRGILDRKISDYAFFVLFHPTECGKTLTEGYQFLTAHSDIMEALDPALLSGFSKQIVSCLQNRRLSALKILFAGRNTIRSIYRMVKRNG